MLTEFVAEPDPPTNLTVESETSKSISLSWAAPGCDGNSPIINYTVRYILESNKTDAVRTTNNTRFNLTGLIPAQTYLIDVAANNFHFKGNFSNQITEDTGEAGMFLLKWVRQFTNLSNYCKSSVLKSTQVAVTESPSCSCTCFVLFFSVPTAPLNFKVNNSLSQQLLLTWEAPERTNGQIQFYEYCYVAKNSARNCSSTTDNSTNAIITNLG